MEFQRLLLQVGQALRSEEVKSLTFLCTDVTRQSLTSVEQFSDLCSALSNQNLLSPQRPQILQELLQTIHRPRLLRDLHLTHPEPRVELISSYRKLLYNLSEDITDDELREVKFLLNPKLPRKKLDENVTTLELFLEMEHMDLLSESNLDLLQTIFEIVCPVLNEKIKHFKQQALTSAAEEMNSSSSVSSPADHNQHFHFEPLPVSGGSSVSSTLTPILFDPTTASVDFPNVLPCINDSGVNPLQVTDSNSVANCSSVKENTDVSAKPAAAPHLQTTNDEEIGTYPMTGAKRGICLIINNYNFINKKKREGTQLDERGLQRVFQWLGFEVEVHADCSGDEMLSAMAALGGRDHAPWDCVACCVLSHGLRGNVLGVDGRPVALQQLTACLSGAQCPSLVDKPKLFFIQACQGVLEQRAVVLQSDGPAACGVEVDAARVESLPADADFLLAMATLPSFVSYREKSSGSWFIQNLCKNLVTLVPRGWDLVSILTKVNADVSKKTGYYYGPKKQMPQPSFSLRKKVVFPVPDVPPPSLEP